MLARPSGHRGNCNLDGLEVVPLRISSKFGPIRMALPRRYPSDAVSAAIQSEGYWEYPSVEAVLASRSGLRFSPRRDTANNDHEPQRAPTMLDIGANLGFYSLLFAAQGWSVLSIEAMEHNRRPLRASLCLNPSLNVTLIGTALGSANASRHRAQCVALSVERNRGNGFLACGEEAARMPPCSQLVHSGRCRDTMHGHGVMSWLPNPKCRGGPYDIAYCERVGLRSLETRSSRRVHSDGMRSPIQHPARVAEMSFVTCAHSSTHALVMAELEVRSSGGGGGSSKGYGTRSGSAAKIGFWSRRTPLRG